MISVRFCRKSFSLTPLRRRKALMAEKSVSMPSRPKTATPWDQDWNTDIIGIPAGPKVGGEVGEAPPTANVRGLVEDRNQRHLHPR